jgi:uncharacterized FAD-dependent dehydrogenase
MSMAKGKKTGKTMSSKEMKKVKGGLAERVAAGAHEKLSELQSPQMGTEAMAKAPIGVSPRLPLAK